MVEYAERQRDPGNGREVIDQALRAFWSWTFLDDSLETFQGAFVVFARIVDRSHDRLIALDEPRGVHFGHEIERVARIIAGALAKESPFLFEPAPKLSVRQRVQQSDHREWNRALADEVYLSLEYIVRIVIEADDEAGHHLHSVALDLSDRVEQVSSGVRGLQRFFQAFFNGCFDAEEYPAKSRPAHSREQVVVIREIDACLG